jgi:hypothetical protein
MVLYDFIFNYSVNGYNGQKEITAPNKEQAKVAFLMWVERNFPWAYKYDFYYEIYREF